MPYHSGFYDVDVRDEIAREFTAADGRVDDMLAGLHEIRARLMARRPWPADAAQPPAAGPSAPPRPGTAR